MKRFLNIRLASALGTAALLAACGGGGDGGNSGFIPPTNDFDSLAAWKNLLAPAAPRSWTVVGQGSDRVNYSLQLSVASAAAAVFPLDGASYSVGNSGSSISGGGTLLGTGLIQTFYDTTFLARGLRNTSNIVSPAGTTTTCDQVLSAALPPAAIKVGNSGALFTTSIKASCNPGAAEIGTSVATWSVEFDSFSASVFFCVNTEERDKNLPQRITAEKDCIEINAAGALQARARVGLTDNAGPGFSLLATNF